MKIVCQKLFEDMDDAANKLLDTMPLNRLRRLDSVVVAISPAAQTIAKKIAKITSSPQELLVSTAIKAPNNHELDIARVSETKDIVMYKELAKSFDIKEDFIYNQASRRYDEQIVPQIYKHRKGEPIPRFDNIYVILVDCGAETGMSVMCAIKSVIGLGAKNVYFAAPVMPKDLQSELNVVTDEIYTPFAVDDYVGTKFYYRNFK
ncbi:MAG: phosphoribosyltransferase [Campylobacterota bacterium]